MRYPLSFGGFPNRYVYWDDTLVGAIEPMLGKDKWCFVPMDNWRSYRVPNALSERVYGRTQREIKSHLRRQLRHVNIKR